MLGSETPIIRPTREHREYPAILGKLTVICMRFVANFFMSPTGSRHLGEMKTSTNDLNLVAIKAPSNFSEIVNHHFNVRPI